MSDSIYTEYPEWQVHGDTKKVDELLPGGGRRGKWRVTAKGSRVPFEGKEKVLKLNTTLNKLQALGLYT